MQRQLSTRRQARALEARLATQRTHLDNGLHGARPVDVLVDGKEGAKDAVVDVELRPLSTVPETAV